LETGSPGGAEPDDRFTPAQQGRGGTSLSRAIRSLGAEDLD
jgi:hypothetical protein